MGSGAFLVEAARQLGEQLRRAWDVHKATPVIPADEDPDLHARRLVAQRCLYGVDKNPFAVDLAKLSLWLVTLAKDHPFTFLDHALKHGDSLVGLNKGQIAEFRWDHETRHHGPLFEHMRQQVGKATALRREIHHLGDEQDAAKRSSLKDADDAIHEARLIGDAAIYAFFAEESEKKRNQRREEVFKEIVQPAQKGDARAINRLEQMRTELRGGERPVTPFHWEIEFPEVFERENPGFDCFVGNPPFMGGTMIGGRLSLAYHDYLIDSFKQSTGLVDLAAFFLRSCFSLLRFGGAFGLLATNTITQGDTRAAGLEQLIREGAQIFDAQRRYTWPGAAAVVVSIVHVVKNAASATRIHLDGKPATRISAFLLPGNGDRTPTALSSNKGLAYVGAKVWGAGFVFEEIPSGGSSSLDDMTSIISRDPRSKDAIYAFMGGEEFNASPTQSPSRYVIDFGQSSEDEARQWPLLFALVEERVRPVRATNKQRNYRDNWWLHVTRAPEAVAYMQRHGRILALTQVSKHLSLAFAKPGVVLSNVMLLLLLHRDADFAIFQSRIHEAWARVTGSSMKDDLRYTTDCPDSFPRPVDTSNPLLDRLGHDYYTLRADLMVRNNEGLTKTYNRFHDPDEHAPDILKLRELHAEMDRAVLTGYGWTDLAEPATCEFRLDYEADG